VSNVYCLFQAFLQGESKQGALYRIEDGVLDQFTGQRIPPGIYAVVAERPAGTPHVPYDSGVLGNVYGRLATDQELRQATIARVWHDQAEWVRALVERGWGQQEARARVLEWHEAEMDRLSRGAAST